MPLLDDVLRDARFEETHAAQVPVDVETAWKAVRGLRPAEVPTLVGLSFLRFLPALVLRRPVPRLRRARTVLDTALEAGFVELASDHRELVLGFVGRPWRIGIEAPVPIGGRAQFDAFDRPGYVRAAIAFRLTPERGGTRIVTTTRVAPTDPGSRRRFARYWAVIRLPSGLIRRDMLRAIKRRCGGSTRS